MEKRTFYDNFNGLKVQKNRGANKEKLRVNPKFQSKVNPISQTYRRFLGWMIFSPYGWIPENLSG